jgi:hypothetical protein
VLFNLTPSALTSLLKTSARLYRNHCTSTNAHCREVLMTTGSVGFSHCRERVHSRKTRSNTPIPFAHDFGSTRTNEKIRKSGNSIVPSCRACIMSHEDGALIAQAPPARCNFQTTSTQCVSQEHHAPLFAMAQASKRRNLSPGYT